MLSGIKPPFVNGRVAHAYARWRFVDAINRKFDSAPPRFVSVFFDGAEDLDRSSAGLARIVHTQKFAILVVQRVSVVLIQRAFAIRPGINAKLQRAVRRFAGVLYQRLAR